MHTRDALFSARLNLEIPLLRTCPLHRLPRRIALQLRQLVTHLAEALPKFTRLELHAGLASDAGEMSLGVLLDLMDEDRIQVPALRAFHIDGFVFEHALVSGTMLTP